LIDPLLNRLAGGMARWGLSANAITVTGFLIGMGAWGALALRAYALAVVLILINRLADGLDGAVARRTTTPPTTGGGATNLGGFLDIRLDFLFYSGVPFFFAVGQPEEALPAAFLVFSFVGTGSSFLAFAVIAAKVGLTTEARGRKSIYYLGGLTEGAETIGLFVLICLFPEHFAVFAWAFGSLCWLTTGGRILSAVQMFRERPDGGP
jgi:phosphatidylglycerophosphate synthase